MDSHSTKQSGENGSVEYTVEGVEDPRVALFTSLVRGLSSDRLHDLSRKVLDKSEEDSQVFVDWVVMAFQTRNVRGGKGEKRLFLHYFFELYKVIPLTTIKLLPLIPLFGYYKDLLAILEMAAPYNDELHMNLKREIIKILADQVKEDHQELLRAKADDTTPKLSLVAKWVPRENKYFARGANRWIFVDLVKQIFPEKHGFAKYRKVISELNRELHTPEVYMCARKYEEINFSRVASLCMKRFRKAFLNEKLKQRLEDVDFETGNRYPEDEGRVKARQNLQNAIKSKIIKGSVLFPHDIVKVFMTNNCDQVSTLERDLLSAQWDSIKEDIIQKSSNDGKAFDLGNLVPLVDVSGSMTGEPMLVAISLGIMVSELTRKEFQDRLITFSEVPTWVDLSEAQTLQNKVSITRSAPWGMNTDFKAALTMILDRAYKARLKPEDIPSLIVFSDMQFDEADHGGKWETQHEQLVKRFALRGIEVCGEPWQVPKIIYWNLRGDTTGYPVNATTKNVEMVSGFSPSMLKLFLEGQMPMETKVTPFETMRKALDDTAYDVIRNIVEKSEEKHLQSYSR